MAAYPETPAPTFPYVIEPEWRTIVSEFDSGEEQRRQKWTYPHYNVKLSYYGLLSSAVANLYEFYQARKGAYEAFHFFEPTDATSHTSVYVGTGNGTSTSFSLPGKETTGRHIYLNGSETTIVAFTTAGGVDGSDLLKFTSSAPTSTQVITASFVGKLRVRCRFADDKLSKTNFEKQLFSAGIELKGLAPA